MHCRRFPRPCLAVAAALVVVACSDILKPEDVTLSIVSPQAGDSILIRDSVNLHAILVDHSGAELTGMPVEWWTSHGDTLGAGATLRTVLPDTGSYDVVARADLGPGGTVAATVTVTVWSLGPGDVTLTIASPAAGDSILAGDSLTLTATLVDRSGRPLADLPVEWSTSRGQTLGQGVALPVALSDTGTYSVVVRADLGFGAFATAAVTVTILPNGPPSFGDVWIPDRLYVHDTVQLIATAVDPESSVVRIEWYGDGGTLSGVGDTITWSPGAPVGSHLVTVRAVDPQGNCTDSVVSVRALSDEHVLWVADAGTWDPWWSDIDLCMLALADDGSLAVGFYDQRVGRDVVVFGPDGKLRWQQTLDASFWDHSSGLTYAPDGTMFVFDFRGTGYAFDPSGTLLWKQQLLGHDAHGRFALDPAGRLYAAGNVVAGAVGEVDVVRLDPLTGADVWRVPISTRGGTYAAGPTVLADGTVTVQAADTVRHVDADGVPLGPPAVAPGAHYKSAADARGYTYLSSQYHYQLVAVGPDDSVMWTVLFAREPGEAVIDADTVIYAAASIASDLTGVDATEVKAITPDGNVLWTETVDGHCYIPRLAILSDGTLLVAAGHYLHTLSRATGAALGAIGFPALIASALAVGPTGTIYVVTGDKRLQAVKGTVPLDPNAPWPIWRRDNRRTASVPH
jgi:hypothetical protein